MGLHSISVITVTVAYTIVISNSSCKILLFNMHIFTAFSYKETANLSPQTIPKMPFLNAQFKKIMGIGSVQRVIDEVRTLPLSPLKGGSKSIFFNFVNKNQC